jgi:AcrR family transcriptional regulator
MNTANEIIKPARVRRDRKDEILEKATQLFAEYGYQGTSFAQVADAVGLTEQGVLHYFPNKVKLLQGVLEYFEQKEIDQYMVPVESAKLTIPGLFGLLEDIYAENEKIPGLIQLFTVLVSESIRADHPSHDYFVNRYRRGREIYVKQFLQSRQNDLRPDIDMNELATLIMAVMDGIQIQWLLDPEKVHMAATFRLFSKMVVDYLENSIRSVG